MKRQASTDDHDDPRADDRVSGLPSTLHTRRTALLSVRVCPQSSTLSGTKPDDRLAAQPSTSAGPADPDRRNR